MAQNLNYGDTIAAPGLIGNSWCYDNDKRNCAQYGRLYSWSAAMDSAGNISNNAKGCGKGKKCTPTYPVRGVCPEGRHFPELAEWQNLADAVDRKKKLCLQISIMGLKMNTALRGLLQEAVDLMVRIPYFGGLLTTAIFGLPRNTMKKKLLNGG